ncbi:uncharacterized protein LOC126996421 isoform X2 [Eriocheir sinensis]|uniref:uncharacterized protein LOC126996421 isoform X2 n=1 Tax=Eriocheir sinensis TaxID=95602 RepID=UPI0021C5E9F9|nr:uncharacterized protein LOC126996421 isoform X2 [Eriocheir sinensis]
MPPSTPHSRDTRNHSGRRMTEAETPTQQQAASREGQKLAVADLQAVKWVAAQGGVRRSYDALSPRYKALRQTTVLGWFIVFYESVAVWWWTFLHNLPWPEALLTLLSAVDTRLVALLEATQQRLEWWWDATGVRLMWLRESIMNFLDSALTRIDSFLLKVQDLVIAIVTFFLKPVANVYRHVVPPTNPEAAALQRLKNDQGSDVNDDEDTEFGDEYLSDASTDSRRILKGGAHGMFFDRQDTTAMAEGKFRAAMYRRVKKELRVMRKNSVRLSYGIVTYAKQMVEPRMRPYADSFQASCQKWAREHEIQEMMRPLQEEWNSSKPPLAKMLSLVQALCVVCLAFLLRLAKGKKSRRTRSMRSESLRRRAQNLACTNNSQLSLSPTALQQSSEPAPSRPLGVPETLPEPALKEDDEYLDGSPAKDSALGSEDNRSDQLDSDHTISPIDEEHDSENDKNVKKAPEINGPGALSKCTNSCVAKKDGHVSPKQKKGVTIMAPLTTNHNSQWKANKTK